MAPRLPRPMETLDTFGLLCPIPIIKTAERVKVMETGAVLAVLSDDRGIVEDLPAWCNSHGHELLSLEEEAPGEFRGLIRKKRGRS